jgi:hypothetical protein
MRSLVLGAVFIAVFMMIPVDFCTPYKLYDVQMVYAVQKKVKRGINDDAGTQFETGAPQDPDRERDHGSGP